MGGWLKGRSRQWRRLAKRWGAQEGFTLVELMVVLAILGILGLIAVPKYSSTVETARLASLRSNAQQIQAALDQYLAEYKKLPTVTDFSALAGSTTAQEREDLRTLLNPYTDAVSDWFLEFDRANKNDGYSVSANQKLYAVVLRYNDQKGKTHHFVITPEAVTEYLDATNDAWNGTITFGSTVSVSPGTGETVVSD